MIVKSPKEDFNDSYYHFSKDLQEYPEAGCYVVWSRRGPGKTYSFLRYCTDNEIFFIYMKRTNDDVELLCTGSDSPDLKVDTDPFVPLNRDFGWNIKPKLIQKGIAGFYDTNEEGKPIGAPIGLIVSMNRVSKVKGSDMSRASFICFDENPYTWSDIKDVFTIVSVDKNAYKSTLFRSKSIGIINVSPTFDAL